MVVKELGNKGKAQTAMWWWVAQERRTRRGRGRRHKGGSIHLYPTVTSIIDNGAA